jgi:AcrR family transcriptional regulator
MPRTPKQLEKIRHDRRRNIMEVALEVFAEHGYEASSISMIATRAGVSKGLMYNYFKSKEDLLLSLMENGLNEMVSMIDPNRDGVLTREEFEYLIEGLFNLMKNRRNFYRLYFALMMQPAVSILFMEKLNSVLEPFLNLFLDYYKDKGAENPMLEAVLIGALFDGIGFNYVFNPGVYPLEEVIEIVKKRFI